MVMILDKKLVTEIARIGEERRPNEACGLLLPTPIRGVQVIELPNRSKTPHDSFEMLGSDMLLALEMTFQGDFPEGLVPSITAWHTHPEGHVGPSPFDLHNKPANIKSLVVTLRENDEPLATWY